MPLGIVESLGCYEVVSVVVAVVAVSLHAVAEQTVVVLGVELVRTVRNPKKSRSCRCLYPPEYSNVFLLDVAPFSSYPPVVSTDDITHLRPGWS